MTKPMEKTLSYAEYIVCNKYPSKYFVVNALQQYVFILTTSRVKADEYRKQHYPLYGLRCTTTEKGGGTGCSETSSTRRGQSKFKSNFGIPRGL